MELKEYPVQKTEIGIIPSDWEIYKVEELLDLLTDYDANGSFSSVAENVKVFDHEEYAWYVRSTDLENNTNETQVRYVDKKSYSFLKKTKLYGGELLFLKRGDIGKVYYFQMKTKRATLAPNLYLLKLNSISFPKYLYYYFNSKNGQTQLKSKNASSTLGALYKDDVKSVFVPLPPTLTEQKAIATALSDVDALITSLDKLIEKKKAIKQGVMQEMLKSSENWTETSLIELADNKKSQFDDGDWVESDYITTEGIRLIQTGNIGIGKFKDRENKKYISEESFKKLNCKEVQMGDLLICRLAEPAGRACVMPDIGEKKVITSVDVSIFRGNPEVANREFLSQLLTTSSWFQKVIEKVGGTTHKRISRGALGEIRIKIPLIDEQDTIAHILADLDAEINLLVDKIGKYESIKQGMMQELLTGKTRLI
jgi:type I restriction enzyme S subunit